MTREGGSERRQEGGREGGSEGGRVEVKMEGILGKGGKRGGMESRIDLLPVDSKCLLSGVKATSVTCPFIFKSATHCLVYEKKERESSSHDLFKQTRTCNGINTIT